MKAVKDIFLLKVDESENRKITIAGKEMFFDPEFDRYKNAIQKATVYSVPGRIGSDQRNDFEVKIGDTVYVHHFVIQPENVVETDDGKMYSCNYRSIFCVYRDGQIYPLEDLVFAEPILEPEENFVTASGIYLKPERENMELQAKVVAVSPYCASLGLKVDDIIHFQKDADYDIKVAGKTYYKIREEHINGILTYEE